MIKYLFILSIISTLTQLSSNINYRIQGEMEIKVDQIFKGFQEERFLDTLGMTETSGWEMELPSGAMVSRSFLIRQADSVIELGPDAIPALCKWVMDEQLYIRFIAVYSLQHITGLAPYVPFFDKDDEDENRQKAVDEWMKWYENHH
jgi:hypothetical protein